MFPVFRNDSFIKLILITPATNNISEKSFSTFKRVKAPIPSTVTKSPPSDNIFNEELDETEIKIISAKTLLPSFFN